MENNKKEAQFVIHDSFGRDLFGKMAEKFARFFGTPIFLIVQTFFVFIWIILNSFVGFAFDPFPYILLNLAFSTQAAYAAPIILLAQTRQAERDKEWEHSDAEHREELHQVAIDLIQISIQNSNELLELTKRMEVLIAEAHQMNKKNENK
jgi:uncharacterized membrane protein